MASNSGGKGAGVGVLGLLGLAFVVLKLCNVIDWEWVYVLMPFWIPAALAVFVITVMAAVVAVDSLLKRK